MNIRPIIPEDREWIAETVGTAFGSVRLMSNDHLIDDASLLGGAGVGSALLEAVLERGKRDGWKRLWLVTSNDNTEAIRMYQRAGWDWTDFRRDAITRARVTKPEIPDTGNHGIPLRHEIQFEAPL
jgi:hypothetical protein